MSNLLTSYMKIVSQTKTEIESISNETFSEEFVRMSLTSLARSNYPIESFERLSENSKKKLVLTLRRLTNQTILDGFLITLKLTGSTDIEFVNVRYKITRNSMFRDELIVQDLDFPNGFYDPSQELKNMLKNHVTRFWEHNSRKPNEIVNLQVYLSSIFILAKKYGDNTMFNIVDAFNSQEQVGSLKTITNLLKDWNNLKDYPVDWSLSIIEHESKVF